jgi:hypothetical protein
VCRGAWIIGHGVKNAGLDGGGRTGAARGGGADSGRGGEGDGAALLLLASACWANSQARVPGIGGSGGTGSRGGLLESLAGGFVEAGLAVRVDGRGGAAEVDDGPAAAAASRASRSIRN